jgi:hypothetical protein
MAHGHPGLDRSRLAALLLERGVTRGPEIGPAGAGASFQWEKALMDWSKGVLGLLLEYRLVGFDPTISPPVFPVQLEIGGCPAGIGNATDFNVARAAASMRAVGWLTHFFAVLLAHRLERGVPDEAASSLKTDPHVYQHLLREQPAVVSALADSMGGMSLGAGGACGPSPHHQHPPSGPPLAAPLNLGRTEHDQHDAQGPADQGVCVCVCVRVCVLLFTWFALFFVLRPSTHAQPRSDLQGQRSSSIMQTNTVLFKSLNRFSLLRLRLPLLQSTHTHIHTHSAHP